MTRAFGRETKIDDSSSMADISSDFRPAYLAALKLWLLLAGLVIIAIWAEASVTGTLTDYLAVAATVFAPGYLATALVVHLRPQHAGIAAMVGYVLLSAYFTVAYVFALIVGPASYSYLVFSNFGWICAVYLYSSLFLGRLSNKVNIANATFSTILLLACIATYDASTDPQVRRTEYGIQPYVYCILAQVAYLLGARVINQLSRAMKESQRRVLTLRQVVAEMMGHEIGTPLQSLVNHVELADLLLSRAQSQVAGSGAETIVRTRATVEHLRRSVEQIQKVLDNAARSMNDAGVGGAKPDADLVDLPQLLEHLLAEFRPRAKQRGLSLQLLTDHPMPQSVVDRKSVV